MPIDEILADQNISNQGGFLLGEDTKGSDQYTASNRLRAGFIRATIPWKKWSLNAGIRVECLPGATAFVPALVNSGIPATRFCFEGFLPLKKGRQTLLKKLATEERTLIFYESPQRLLKTLEEFCTYFGEERSCSVSRELTKRFEENFRGTLRECVNHFSSKTIKGEIVIVLAGLS